MIGLIQRKEKLIGVAILACTFALPAKANLLAWTASGVFAGGGSVSGTFDFDASTDLYGNIHIVTSTDADFAGGIYKALLPGAGSFAGELAAVPSLLADYTNTAVIEFNFDSYLTDAGGAVSAKIFEGSCMDATCNNISALRMVTGEVTAAPEPASIGLLGVGLLSLAILRRRPS